MTATRPTANETRAAALALALAWLGYLADNKATAERRSEAVCPQSLTEYAERRWDVHLADAMGADRFDRWTGRGHDQRKAAIIGQARGTAKGLCTTHNDKRALVLWAVASRAA